MAIVPILSELDDGGLESLGQEPDDGLWPSAFQKKAREGNNVRTDQHSDPMASGHLTVGGYMGEAPGAHLLHLFQSWMRFIPQKGFFLAANEELVTASLRVSLHDYQYRGSGPNLTNDSMQGWSEQTTFPLSSGSWKSLEALRYSALYDFEFYRLQSALSTSNLLEAGGEQFLTNLKAKLAAGIEQHQLLTNGASMADFGGGSTFRLFQMRASNANVEARLKPYLILRTTKRHDLNMVGSSSIQMTDGTAVFLRYDRLGNRVGLYYQRVNQSTATLIGWVPTTPSENADNYYMKGEGFQTFALTRDESNNLFIAGMRGALQSPYNSGVKRFNVSGYRYNGNYSWTGFSPAPAGENTIAADQTHRGLPNNFALVWLPNSARGGAGQLAIVHSHRDGQWARYQLGVATLYAGWLIGQGTSGKNHDINYADVTDSLSQWRPFNSVATGLDAIPDGNTVRFGSFIPATSGSDVERSAVGKSSISESHVVGKPSLLSATISTASPHDPDAKIRVLDLGGRYAVAREGTITVYSKSNDSQVAHVDLTGRGIANFPNRAILQGTQSWDVIWDSTNGSWIWVYYRDVNNPRLLRKVRWDFNTNEISSSFQFTPSPLGESGSSIEAIRVPRGIVDNRCVLVDVAMQTGAGNPLPLITLRDTTMNAAPSPPAIRPIDSFNAIGSKQVDWSFFDPNDADFATFQDVEIRSIDTGAIVHSAEHTTLQIVSPTTRVYRYTIPANTLTNDSNYQIRIRSYDSTDFPSEWSGWVQFSTTATGGLVTIISPATDNEPLNDSQVPIGWEYTNSDPTITQSGYRVRAFNNDTNVLTSDSGVVQSAATEYLLTGLTSDVEYRVEVTILDSAGETSGAGIRLVTPDFNNPSVPTLIASGKPGYIEVRISNPPPTGGNPLTARNFIARKEANAPDDTYVIIGECPPNGVYQDWTVASGVAYTYKARGSSD